MASVNAMDKSNFDIKDQPVVLFDGVCNFCNRWINFAIRHDKKRKLRFTTLQGNYSKRLWETQELKAEDKTSVVLVENGKVYTRSTAVLRISRHLDGGWKLLYGFVIIPRFIRDPVYNWIGRNRYAWFGKRDTCMIPSPGQKERFID